MRYSELLLVLVVWIQAVNLAPLNPDKPSKEEKEEEEVAPDSLMDGPQTGLEYEKYLEQVIQVMEINPEMKDKLSGMTMEDLRSGRLAEEIDMLDNNIRTELDELKRLEIQRLRNIARKRMETGGHKNLDTKFIDNLIGHIDPADTETFGPSDFKKLMEKATSDLEEADRRRKTDFKKYEMEKELRRRNDLQKLEEKDREEAIQEWEKAKEARKNHPKMKHPGSKAQLEDVWEKTDHLEKETFNPKTFFMLHDTNGDFKLDQFELEALFIKEVGKFYKGNDQTEMWEEISRMREHVQKEVEDLYKGTKADPKEKFEEIYRMREHVMKEIDVDGDKLVTLQEFLDATKQENFEKDEGWEDLQQKDQYTEDELEEYRAAYDEVVKEKKEKLRREQEEYLKRRKEQGAGDPVVMNQEKIMQVAADAADEIINKVNEKKMKFDPNASNNKVEDLQAAQRQQEALAQQQAAQLQQAAQQAAQQQQAGGQPGLQPQAAGQPAAQDPQAIQQAAAAVAAQLQAAQQQAAQQQAAQQQAGDQAAAAQQPGLLRGAQLAQQAAAAISAQQQAAQQQAAQQQVPQEGIAAQQQAVSGQQGSPQGSIKINSEAAEAVKLALAQQQAQLAQQQTQQQAQQGGAQQGGAAPGGKPLVPGEVDANKMP